MKSRKWVILVTSTWGDYGFVQAYYGLGRMKLVSNPKNAKWFWTRQSAETMAASVGDGYGNSAEVVEYNG